MRGQWVKELQNLGVAKAVKIPTTHNVADLLTKCHALGSMTKLMGLVTI